MKSKKPTPADDEVLIKVHASSINSWDWEFLNGTFINRLMFGLLRPKAGKQILGADIAGTVEFVGTRVNKFQPGDKVFGDMWDNWGGFAEFICARETSLEFMPENSTFEEAASVPQAGVLALQGLLKVDKLEPGHKVLINGAGGGVGTFAIQLAKLSGAEVTGVDTAHKLETIRSVGAHHSIDYQQTDYTITGEHYDLIIDCEANRSISDYKRALKPKGTFVMIGGSTIMPKIIQNFWSRFTGESRKFYVVMDGPNKGLDYLKELIENGNLQPVIDKTFELHDVHEAMRYFGRGLQKGKIVISIFNKKT